MKIIDYTEKLKDFRDRISKLRAGEILEYTDTEAFGGTSVAVVQLPDTVNAVDAADKYLGSDTRIYMDDAPAEDIVCEFIERCRHNWVDEPESKYTVLEPDNGKYDFSFLDSELDGYNLDSLVAIIIDDYDYDREVIVAPIKVLIEAAAKSAGAQQEVAVHNIKIDFDKQEVQIFDTYEKMMDSIEADELDPNDSSVTIVRTVEPEESLEEYLENSKVWLNKIADDKQQTRDAHAAIIVTLRDAYLQTFEQIAKLLSDYYGVNRTRQSIHSLYERVKKRESNIVNYENQREILLMRILGMSIAKIHDKFPQLTEYGITEIIKENQRESEELQNDLIDNIAKRIAVHIANVGEYKACGDYESYNKISQSEVFEDIKNTLGVPRAEINDKEFNRLINLAIERVAADRIAVLASMIYESQTPSLKSAKSFMVGHGISDNGVTAKNLKELWTH